MKRLLDDVVDAVNVDNKDDEDEEEEKCSRKEHGACDCKECLELIVRNGRLLFAKGFVVNWCDNGAGGYGFDVAKISEFEDNVLCPLGKKKKNKINNVSIQ
jgi:hypothetical protein